MIRASKKISIILMLFFITVFVIGCEVNPSSIKKDGIENIKESTKEKGDITEKEKGVTIEISDDGNVMYIADGGEGDGSSPQSPLKAKIVYDYDENKVQRYYENTALYQAVDKLKETGGTVVICGEVSIGIEESYGSEKNERDFIFPENGTNAIKITSSYGGVDYSATNNARLVIESPAHIQMMGESIWENIEICTKGTGRVIACGNYTTVFGEGIKCTTDGNKKASAANATYFINIAGSGRYESPASSESVSASKNAPKNTNLTIMSGTYGKVVGGLWGVYLSRNYYVFEGDSNITISGDATILGGVIGGCNANNSYQTGNANITINGGTIYGKIEGTNKMAFRNNDAAVNIKINGADFTNCDGIYGGFNGLTSYYQPYFTTVDFSGYKPAEYETVSKLLADKYTLTAKNNTADINEVILPSGEKLTINLDDINKNMVKEDIDSMRQKVIDYMYAMSQVKWTPPETFSLVIEGKYSFTFREDVTHYGLPYSSTRAAQLEEFESVIKDGVYNGPTDVNSTPGNHCTSSIFGSWARIGNSVTATWSKNMLPSEEKGVVALGSYDWRGYTPKLLSEPTTTDLVKSNGKQTMFEAYALLRPADAILRRETTWGHARLISKDTVVVRNTDGTIDGHKSHVITVEQTSSWDKIASVKTCWWVNHKYTFNQLFDTNYIPITCVELLTGMAEKPEVSVLPEIKASDITGGFTSTVSSNYNVFWTKVEITDNNGKIVYSGIKYPYTTSRSYAMSNFNGDLSSIIPSLKSGEYTCTISVLVRGESVVVDKIKFTK